MRWKRSNRQKPKAVEPVYGVEVLDRGEIERPESPDKLRDLYERMKSGEVSGFIIPEEVVIEAIGEETPLEGIAHALGKPILDRFSHGTLAGVHSPLHTDRKWLIPSGGHTRLHRIDSKHTSMVELGRLEGHERITGREYIEQSGAGIQIPTMFVGEAKRGDVTVFEVSADVVHRFSAPKEGKRTYDIVTLGF